VCSKSADHHLIQQAIERATKPSKEILKRVNQNAIKYAKNTELNIARIKI
jgi:pyrroloquinoline quinone biosynthesis protein E